MGIKAAGRYLRLVREGQRPKITQATVADACGVNERTVRLWEEGDLTPGAVSLSRYIECISAHLVHVHLLLLDNTDDLEQAQLYADVWLQGGTTIMPNTGQTTPQDRVYRAHELLHQLSQDELAMLVALEAGRLSSGT
jgi:DNA-binding XRE family transcriptional regulator